MRKSEQNFSFWWNTSGPWVEEPNVRRSGTSGVQRVIHDGKTVYVKRQTGHIFRSLRYPFGRPTVLREGKALSRLLELGVTAPLPIFYGAKKIAGVWHGLLVTKDLTGFKDLDTWYDQGARFRLTQDQHLQIFEKLADLLSKMHLGRWQHGCMRSKHIFIRELDTDYGPKFELALLDLEKSHGRASSMRAARHDIPQLRRHSHWTEMEWRFFLYHYEKRLGRSLSAVSR